jgi:hypothetical protein
VVRVFQRTQVGLVHLGLCLFLESDCLELVLVVGKVRVRDCGQGVGLLLSRDLERVLGFARGLEFGAEEGFFGF